MIADTFSFGALNYVIFFVYLAAMFGIGLRLAGKQKTTEGYFLAGRNMPWFIVAMSMFASLTSATSYMGIPGTAYKENISLIVLGLVSVAVAPVLILLFYPFYRRLNITTSYEYIAKRFGRNARFATSSLFVLARLGWLGVVIYAPALALSVVTGMNLYLAILMMGILATAYTALGGLAAVLWTDVLQFIFLVGGAVWVAITLLTNVPGGFTGIVQVARETDHLQVLNWKLSLFEMTGLAVILSYFFQLMQDYGTDQVTVQRLMATKSLRKMAQATIVNSFFDLAIVSLLLFVGLGMFAYYQHFPDRITAGIGGDKVMPYYIMQVLPAGVSGLLITAIFAAAMSSMDSGINSLSTVIVNDFVKPLRKRPREDYQDVKLARVLTVALGMFAVGVACYAATVEQLLKASSSFLGLFAGPILGLFLLGILTRKGKFPGWMVGTFLAIVVTIWVQNKTEVHWIYYFPLCFGLSFIVGYLVSFVFSGHEVDPELTLWGRNQLPHQDG